MNFEQANREVELQKKANTTLEKIDHLKIENLETYRFAESYIVEIKEFKKQVNGFLDPIIKATNEAHKMAVAKKKSLLEPVEEKEELCLSKMRTYQIEQERKAQEAIAKAKEEEDRLRKEQEAAMLETAIKAEEAGKPPEIVDAIANHVIPIHVAPEIENLPDYDKRTFKDKFDYKVVNFDLIPREFLKVDESKVKAQIKVTKGKTNIPGIAVFLDTF